VWVLFAVFLASVFWFWFWFCVFCFGLVCFWYGLFCFLCIFFLFLCFVSVCFVFLFLPLGLGFLSEAFEPFLGWEGLLLFGELGMGIREGIFLFFCSFSFCFYCLSCLFGGFTSPYGIIRVWPHILSVCSEARLCFFSLFFL